MNGKKNRFGKEKKMDRPDDIEKKDCADLTDGQDEEVTVKDAGSDEFEQPTQAEWREALEKAVAQRDEFLGMAQRAQADYQNFKRRNEHARTDGYNDGVRETIALMLPTLDNLDRAIDAAKEAGNSEAMLEGVEMTRRQFLEALSKIGLEEIPALGEKFDPELHDAVMRTEEGEPGTVTEVFQKGYRVKDKIIRYSMVKVAVE